MVRRDILMSTKNSFSKRWLWRWKMILEDIWKLWVPHRLLSKIYWMSIGGYISITLYDIAYHCITPHWFWLLILCCKDSWLSNTVMLNCVLRFNLSYYLYDLLCKNSWKLLLMNLNLDWDRPVTVLCDTWNYELLVWANLYVYCSCGGSTGMKWVVTIQK